MNNETNRYNALMGTQRWYGTNKPIGDNFTLPGTYTLEELKNVIKLIESAKEKDKQMNKKHKHYDVIVAWAEGKEIQWRICCDEWIDWKNDTNPPRFDKYAEYRIKPEPKPDVVIRESLVLSSDWSEAIFSLRQTPNLRLTFDGETGKLKKAEVIDGSN